MIKPVCAALILFAPISALAQSQDIWADRYEKGIPIDPEAFGAMTEGRAMTYSDGYQDVYIEYYPPGTNAVILRYVGAPNDECQTGIWRPDGDLICFDWDIGATVCSGWARHDGVVISQLFEDGNPLGGFEPISQFSETPISCTVGMVSYEVGQ
ncbi:MAG: hypothetical protein WD046_09250 [Paracoccaceae bacterium]